MPGDVDELLSHYVFPEGDQPWLRTVFVSTLDGAAVGADGLTSELGGEVDSQLFAGLRRQADVVLVGANTARLEGYRPLSDPNGPRLALISDSLDIPDGLNVPETIVVTSERAAQARAHQLSAGVDVLTAGDSELSWPAVPKVLAEIGLRRINCEGGPSIHGAFVEHDLVDELSLTLDPTMTAGSAQRITDTHSAFRRRFALTHSYPIGDIVFLRYLRQR